MTLNQSTLLDFLQKSDTTPEAKLLLKRSFQDFVLEYGWWYEPTHVPKEIATGQSQECFKNAAELSKSDGSLIYCEGYALFKRGMLPTLHAWVTDGQGNAIDNTWPTPGVAYSGVPFKWNFVTMTALKNHAVVSLLDDWQNKWPLRDDLGDRPDEWLELRGQGTERVGKMD